MSYARLTAVSILVGILVLTKISPAQAICFTTKPKITAVFDLQETKYDFSKSVKDIATIYSLSRQSELAFGTYTNNFNLKIGNEQYVYKEKKYDKNASLCVHLKNIEVVIGIKPIIRVPIEAYKKKPQTCFKDILEHEKGHDVVTRELIRKYDKIIIKELDKILTLKNRNKIAETNNAGTAQENYRTLINIGLKNAKNIFTAENTIAQNDYHDEVESSTRVCGFLYETALEGKKNVYDYFNAKD